MELKSSKLWYVSHSADRRVRSLADRHYNRQKPGSLRFIPPGMCLVFRTVNNDAVWSSSWPFKEYVRHGWKGAWINTLFRNESDYTSSDLITEALSCTLSYWIPPKLGMISFVDPNCVPGVMRRGERIFGYCYLKAGWSHVGFSQGGLWTWQILPENMPSPMKPIGKRNSFGLIRKSRKE